MAVDLVTRLTLKNQQFQNSLNQSKRQVKDFKRSVSDIGSIKNLQVTFGNLAKGIDKGSLSVEDFSTSLVGLGTKAGAVAAAVGAAAAVIGVIVSKSVQARREMESMEVSFSVLTGSMERAKSLIGQMKELGAASPLQTSDIAKAGQTLMGFGVDVHRVMPILRQLSDISMGDSQRFQSLALAFAQMSAQGRLMGQDLNQMVNAGFNPLQIISEKTGKSIGQLKDEMSRGKISSQDIANAFAAATQEGGKFYGMTEKLGKSLNGMFNQQQDKLNQQWAELGERIAPAVIGAMELISEAIEVCFDLFNKYVDVIQEFNNSFKDAIGVSYFEAIGAVLKVVLKLLKGVIAASALMMKSYIKIGFFIVKVWVKGYTALYKVLGKVWKAYAKLGAYISGALTKYFGGLYRAIKPVVDMLGRMLGRAYNSIDNALSPNKKKVYKTKSGRNLKEGEVYSYQKTENGKRYEYTKGIKNGKLVTIDKREISKVNQLNNVLGDNNKVLNKNKKSIVDQKKIYNDTLEDLKLQSNELEDIKTNINLINKALNNLPRTSVYRNNLEKILNQQLGKEQKIEIEYIYSEDWYEKNISDLQDRLKKINPDTNPEKYKYTLNQIYILEKELQNLRQHLNKANIKDLENKYKTAQGYFYQNPTENNLINLGIARGEFINNKSFDLQNKKDYVENELNLLQTLYDKILDLQDEFNSAEEEKSLEFQNRLKNFFQNDSALSSLITQKIKSSKTSNKEKSSLEKLLGPSSKTTKEFTLRQFQTAIDFIDKLKETLIKKLVNYRREIEKITIRPYSRNSLNELNEQLYDIQNNINNFGDALRFGKNPFDIKFDLKNLKASREQYQLMYEVQRKMQLIKLSTDPQAGINFAQNFGLSNETYDQLMNLYTLMKSNADIGVKMASAFGMAGQAIGDLGNAFQNSGLSKAALVAAAIGNILLGFATASAEAGKKGMIYWIAATLSGLATVASVIGQLSSYSTGGIIEGNSTHGDQVLARVNAGEMILNPRQQSNLFDMLNNGVSGGSPSSVEFKIRGDVLYGVLHNFNKIHNKIR